MNSLLIFSVLVIALLVVMWADITVESMTKGRHTSRTDLFIDAVGFPMTIGSVIGVCSGLTLLTVWVGALL